METVVMKPEVKDMKCPSVGTSGVLSIVSQRTPPKVTVGSPLADDEDT